MITRLGKDHVFAGENDMIVSPSSRGLANYACIYVHGAEAGAGCYDWMTASPYRWPLFRNVADTCGIVGVSADLGGSATWGNATVQSRLDAAFTYTQTLPGVKLGKVILVAQSMGGVAALVWAKNNPSKAACVVGLIPVTNLTHAWATSSYTAAINAAYGGAYSEAVYGANFNPATFRASLNGIKGQLWVGQSDPLAREFDAAYIRDVAPTMEVKPIPGTHAESTLGNIDLTAMASFINANKQ